MRPDWNKRSRKEPSDELGRDMDLASALELLDPVRSDPGYWMRFHSRVMRLAAPELARRRLMREQSLPEVVMSWSRAVVSAAMLAAALAGMMLVRDHTVPKPATVGVEELLAVGTQGSTIPAELERTQVAFASESF